jgi:hypothetical protein
MSLDSDGEFRMIWTATREATTDLFMNAPIDEVTRHLCRELGEFSGIEGVDNRRTGYPSAFSFDPASVARPMSGNVYSPF